MSEYFKQLIDGTKSLFIGLGITGKYFLEPVVTMQYPMEHVEMTPRYRGHIELIPNEETGEPKCVACGMCEKGCPSGCITVKGEKYLLKAIYLYLSYTPRRKKDTAQSSNSTLHL